MGLMSVLAMREAGQQVSQDELIAWHFQGNCYPPIPLAWIKPAKRAIKLVSSGRSQDKVYLRRHVKWCPKASVAAWKLVEAFHLEGFLDNEED
jgi:hypothetical protein